MVFKAIVLFAARRLEGFRLPELQAVADTLRISFEYEDAVPDITHPFMIINFRNEEEARMLGSRAVLVRWILEYWSDGRDYEECHNRLKSRPEIWEKYQPSTSFKFSVSAYERSMTTSRQVEVIDDFAWLGFKGKIDLRNPELDVAVYEEYERIQFGEGEGEVGEGEDGGEVGDGRKGKGKSKGKGKGKEGLDGDTSDYETEHGRRLIRVWVGRKVCEGQRHLVDVFDLKKRAYIGNTSMDAELSLIMANMGLARPGKVVYDPFVGTGSMLYTNAHFGAFTFGSDIDGRHIRGKKSSVLNSADQYGIREKLVDNLIFDITQNPWRIDGFVDAIVTDPPYGIRAGAKRLGRRDPTKHSDQPHTMPDGTLSHVLPDYVPPTRPWEMSEVLEGLLEISLRLLKPGGRLVYWLPTVSETYDDSDVPKLEGFKLVANSCQDFGKWARRLITMEKLKDARSLPRRIGADGVQAEVPSSLDPAHRNFREKYFAGFEDRL